MSLKSTAQSQSLPTEIEIDNAYDLAYRICGTMRQINSYQISFSELCSIGFAEAEGLERAIKRWSDFREERSDILDTLLLQLESDAKQLQDLFSPLWRLFQSYAYNDLGDFSSGGRKWGRCAFPTIQTLAMEVRFWGLQCQSLYRVSWLQPIDSELREVCERQEAGFPMSTELESDIRERLFREQGRMIKGLAEAQALIVATKPVSNWKSRGRSDDEVEQEKPKRNKPKDPAQLKLEKQLIAFLREFEKWKKSEEKKTGKKRLNSSDWVDAKAPFTGKTMSFYNSLTEESEDDPYEIVKRKIRYAQKLVSGLK
jgi:hypothetical protein